MSISPQLSLPFPPAPRVRASLKPGAPYAIDGGDSFIYYEMIAIYDAEAHVPERPRVDHTEEVNAWPVGESIRRERLKMQALARKFPESPCHQLPEDWVPVNDVVTPPER